MIISLITLTLITTSLVNGLHSDAVGASCGQRYHRSEQDRIGCPGKPEDWPKDGPGVHNGPPYRQSEPDNYIGEDDYEK